MLTLILAEHTNGEVYCSAKIGGRILVHERAVDWNQAIEWARAVAANPPEGPPRPRTRYPVATGGHGA